MEEQDSSSELLKKLEQLSAKYEQNGQNVSDYLDSMMHTRYLNYWDYVQLETLLSLQRPKTDVKDEMIFVAYHQITELYFKLILWELAQLTDGSVTEPKVFLDKIQRLNRYFHQLESSFSIMTKGMEHRQFNEFRMALIPSSGFQSVQYRLIELHSTDAINLVHPDHVLWLSSESTDQDFLDQLYWKAGARDVETGEKTLMIRQFEEKYDEVLLDAMTEARDRNLRQQIQPFIQNGEALSEQIIEELRTYDQLANVYWPLAHFRTAVRYLVNGKEDKPATGGTNWRQYLPPRYQRIIFFPELWTDEEKDDWGKSWVLEHAPLEE
ncbi:tryptophan 2,3-dioxygenase family protein [Tunicatimonas pelagia]|uniref:tryptophan 2,3-dioxygenase family protein n=1 Tax=Tunicatimonas pelagia TaxID=931531 RepID=UPI0026652DEE|nr:tryptophan 2,3-dioxygenase family protein [Tunicatimonas pelagia]WKN42538.1 tryptophan 2,3-dioxygenase family protein [Tunicatimonas pelagia]